MRKFAYVVSIISMAVMFVLFVVFFNTESNTSLILAIAAMTVCYHFIVRVVITNLCDYYCNSKNLSPKEHFFRPKPFEKELYRRLRVRLWKDKFPNYDPNGFSLRRYSVDELIFESCKTEMIHWFSTAMSLLSLLFVVWFGHLSIYLPAAIFGTIYDMAFVVTQRFNRPRLEKIAATGKYN